MTAEGSRLKEYHWKHLDKSAVLNLVYAYPWGTYPRGTPEMFQVVHLGLAEAKVACMTTVLSLCVVHEDLQFSQLTSYLNYSMMTAISPGTVSA